MAFVQTAVAVASPAAVAVVAAPVAGVAFAIAAVARRDVVADVAAFALRLVWLHLRRPNQRSRRRLQRAIVQAMADTDSAVVAAVVDVAAAAVVVAVVAPDRVWALGSLAAALTYPE